MSNNYCHKCGGRWLPNISGKLELKCPWCELQRLRAVLIKRDDMLRKQAAEIERLKSDAPGTPRGRLAAIEAQIIRFGLCTGFEAQPPELFLIKKIERLREEITSLAIRSESVCVCRELRGLSAKKDMPDIVCSFHHQRERSRALSRRLRGMRKHAKQQAAWAAVKILELQERIHNQTVANVKLRRRLTAAEAGGRKE